MAIASGSNHSAYYVTESEYGVTPATPAFKPFRHTGFTLGLSKDALQSEELRDDRQISCYLQGNEQVGGDVNSELTYTDFDDMLEAALGGTWGDTLADRLTVGTERRSFTVERNFGDISKRIRYTGCEVSSMSISVQPNAIVTATWSMVGSGMDGYDELAGATYGTSQGGCPFDSFSGTILEGGTEIGYVTSLEMSLENSIEAQFAVGSNKSIDSTIGRSNATGNLTVYFQDEVLLEKFRAGTSSSLEFSLSNEAGDTLTFSLPNIKYTEGQPDVSGDGSVTMGMGFQALYSAGAGSNMIVDRTPA